MPLITKGIEVGIGAIGAKKEKKQAEAPQGMPEAGGGAGAAPAGGAGGAEGAAAAQNAQVNQIDRFIQALDNPNIRSIGDIKNFRDQVLGKMQGAGLNPQQLDDAKKKLNHAILKKLGIAQPGANGSMVVNLTPQNQQILQALGMQPDQVTQGGAAGAPAQPGAAPAPPGAPQPAAAGPAPAGAAPGPGGAPAVPGLPG